jgi:hypothetical protein
MANLNIRDCDIPSRRISLALVRQSEDEGKVWSLEVWDDQDPVRPGLPEITLTLSLESAREMAGFLTLAHQPCELWGCICRHLERAAAAHGEKAKGQP